jgi:hypothetical protein
MANIGATSSLAITTGLGALAILAFLTIARLANKGPAVVRIQLRELKGEAGAE